MPESAPRRANISKDGGGGNERSGEESCSLVVCAGRCLRGKARSSCLKDRRIGYGVFDLLRFIGVGIRRRVAIKKPDQIGFCMHLSKVSASLLLVIVQPFVVACGGEDAAPADPWDSRTYLLEVPKTNWSEPPGIGDEIGDFVPHFLFRMKSSGGGSYEVTLGTADAAGDQDPCNPTSSLAASSMGAPNVEIGPSEVPVRIQHISEDVTVNATIHDFALLNVLPDGSTPAEEGELTATMDLRELYPLLTLLIDPTPESSCEALGQFGAPCEDCPTDGKTFCLSVKAVRLGAEEVNTELVAIDPADPDPSCSE